MIKKTQTFFDYYYELTDYNIISYDRNYNKLIFRVKNNPSFKIKMNRKNIFEFRKSNH